MPAERVCNICGQRLDFFDEQQELTIHKRLEYGSRYDGDIVRLRMCCDCFDNLVDNCAVSPIEEVVE